MELVAPPSSNNSDISKGQVDLFNTAFIGMQKNFTSTSIKRFGQKRYF